MRRIIDAIEVIGEVDAPEGACDVCASAQANYDDASAKLLVDLDAFLRTTDIRTREKRFSADWLPKHELVREGASPEEAGELARDIFHRWVRKVRQATPVLKTHQL
jgi:hypothetical protein